MKKVSTIFKEKPEKWGLRGDPYFWEYLENIFDNYELPFEYEKLEKIIKDEHLKLTGIRLTKDSIAKCEKFEHGGMSFGGLSGEFWTTNALPLLKERLNKKSIFGKLLKNKRSLIMGIFRIKKNQQDSIRKNVEEIKNYIKETDDYTLEISNDIMSDETLQYAKKIVEKYFSEKDKILDYFLEIELRKFYKTKFGYSDEYIKENLGKPYIIINFKNEGNDNWKFTYAGIIDYNENKLDEHLISIEFSDDLDFDDYMQFNG